MGSILLIVTTAIRLWPLILGAIHAAEAAFPIPKAGKDKLDAVLAGIGIAYDMTASLQGLPKPQVLAIATSLTTKAVAAANATGDFKPTAPAA